MKQLLNEDPNTRPSAEELLKTPFWLEVAVDYQKGKAFMMKQVAVATENSEKAVAMLIDNMQTSQVDVTLKKSGSGGSRYKTPSHQSDEVSSIQNDEELVEVRKKEKKRSKVKFELESDESSTVEEYEEGSEAGEESESSKRKDNDDASSGALSDEASENPTGEWWLCAGRFGGCVAVVWSLWSRCEVVVGSWWSLWSRCEVVVLRWRLLWYGGGFYVMVVVVVLRW